MASIQVFLWMKNRDGEGEDGFRTLARRLDFTRVPVEGEFVNLGDDEGGQSADYRVVAVVHAPLRRNNVDAEIYLERVYWSGELRVIDRRVAAEPAERSEVRPRDVR